MDPLHLRSAGTSLLISFDSGEAEVLHWGADLGAELPDLAVLAGPVGHSSIDARVPASLLPQASSSWRGRPALRGHRISDGATGLDFSSRLRVTSALAGGPPASAYAPSMPFNSTLPVKPSVTTTSAAAPSTTSWPSTSPA